MSKNEQDPNKIIGKLGMEQIRMNPSASQDTHHVEIRPAEPDNTPVRIVREIERRVQMPNIQGDRIGLEPVRFDSPSSSKEPGSLNIRVDNTEVAPIVQSPKLI